MVSNKKTFVKLKYSDKPSVFLYIKEVDKNLQISNIVLLKNKK